MPPFVVGDTQSLRGDLRFRDADIVMAIGVLHHLDDQDAVHCIRFANDALKETGRLYAWNHVGSQIRAQFPGTSCLMTEAEYSN